MNAVTFRAWVGAAAVALLLAPAAAAQTPQPPPDPQSAGAQQQPPPPPAEPPQQPPPAAPAPPQTVFGVPGSSSQVPTPYTIAAPAREGRPNRSVFGVPASNKTPILTIEGLVGGGKSGDPLATQRGGAPGGGAFGGSEGGSGAATGSANLTLTTGFKGIGLNGSGVFYGDYYPQYEHAKFQPRTVTSLSLDFMVGRSTRVTLTQGYKNLPELGFSELQDPDFSQAVPISQDLAVTAERYGRYGINADVSHRLSRRMKADASVGWAHGALTSGSSWETQSVMANLSYAIGKGLAAYAGYVMGAQTFHNADGRTSRDTHPSIRFGLDYGKALSLARRTTLAFTTGVAQIEDRVADVRQYELVGAVSLKREFGRSWETGVVFSRNVRYLEALDQPLLTNSLGFITSGSFSRRIQVKGAFGASAGQLAAISGNTFDTYFGGAQMTYGLSRNLALGADYGYSRLSNPPGALPILATGLYTQNSARVFVQFWAPLVSRPRRP